MDNKINNEEKKVYYVKKIERLENQFKVKEGQLSMLSIIAVGSVFSNGIVPELRGLVPTLITLSLVIYCGVTGLNIKKNIDAINEELEKCESEKINEKVEEFDESEKMKGKTR